VSSSKGGFPGPLSPDSLPGSLQEAAMPKKSQKALRELTDTFYEWAACRWEFQRRNEAYRKWWQQNRPSENLKYPDPDLSFEQLIDLLKQNVKIFADKLVKKKYIPMEKQEEAESQTYSIAIFQIIFTEAIAIDINNDMSTLEMKIDFRKDSATIFL
jgi:hypothetical protein